MRWSGLNKSQRAGLIGATALLAVAIAVNVAVRTSRPAQLPESDIAAARQSLDSLTASLDSIKASSDSAATARKGEKAARKPQLPAKHSAQPRRDDPINTF